MTLLRSKTLGAAGLLHAFPERGATDLDLARELGLPAGAAIVQVKQIHGGDAIDAVDVTTDAATDRGADALVARASGGPVAVGIRVADCVPVLVADTRRRVVAAFHAGWRGTLARIVERGIGTIRLQFGSRPKDLIAAIGPGIGACCYEVGEEVARRFGLARAGRLDLAAENLRQLTGHGVPLSSISVAGVCTLCNPAQFYSFRRDREAAGRMISYIRLLPDTDELA